jgi:hypothetical protein
VKEGPIQRFNFFKLLLGNLALKEEEKNSKGVMNFLDNDIHLLIDIPFQKIVKDLIQKV